MARPSLTPSRRAVVKALALTPLAMAAGRAPVSATDYATPAEVMAAIDAAESAVARRLRAILRQFPAAAEYCNAALVALAQHSAARARLRQRLGLAAPLPIAQSRLADESDLEGLRGAQQELVYAHAEGLPALGDARAVSLLAGHMVTLAQHLSVTLMWIELEEARD